MKHRRFQLTSNLPPTRRELVRTWVCSNFKPYRERKLEIFPTSFSRYRVWVPLYMLLPRRGYRHEPRPAFSAEPPDCRQARTTLRSSQCVLCALCDHLPLMLRHRCQDVNGELVCVQIVHCDVLDAGVP
jgi:hypothetical protein